MPPRIVLEPGDRSFRTAGSGSPKYRRARWMTDGPCVTICYIRRVARQQVVLSYDEAMAICPLLVEAADAAADAEQLRDTWAGEARVMIELILRVPMSEGK